MMENGLSVGDVAALTNNDGFGGTGGWLWFLIVMFAIWGGGFGFGGRGEQYATSAEVHRGFDNQNVMTRFDTISQNQTNAAYENANLINRAIYDNAQLINNSTIVGMQNANSINSNMNDGFNSVNANLNNLAHQLEQCCCNLKTQMLQDRYQDVHDQLTLAEITASNAVQTQNLLGNMGKWYPYPPAYVNYYTPYYGGGTVVG